MKIRWGSTYAMLNRAEKLKKVFCPLPYLFVKFKLLSMSIFAFTNWELN